MKIDSIFRKIALLLMLAITLIIQQSSFAADNAKEAEKLWELGEKAYNSKKYNEALSYYQKSLSLCAADLECRSSNFNGLGRSYEALGDDKKALSYYEEALKIERQRNNKDGIATNLFNVGAIYRETFNQYEKSLIFLKESERIFRELGDKTSLAIVLFHSGKALNSLGKYQDAMSYFNESIKLNRELKDTQAVAANLNLIGNVYAKLGQYDKPISYYEEALAINKKINNQLEISITLTNIGDAYADLMKYDKSIPYYMEALEIQKKNNFNLEMSVTFNNMGALYDNLDQHQKAVSYYENALKIGRDLRNEPTIATALNNIGNKYSDIGMFDKALAYLNDALVLEKKLNRPMSLTYVLNNIGMLYFKLGRYDESINYLNDALKIDRQLNNPHSIALRLNNIGAVYLKQKKYKNAENVFLERMMLKERIKPNVLLHPGLIQVYLETNRFNEAQILIQENPPTWRNSMNRHFDYHVQMGMVLKGKGVLNDSSQEFLKAAKIIEEMRQTINEKTGFFGGSRYIGRLTPHRELVNMLSELTEKKTRMPDVFNAYGKDPASVAFYFAELTKARTLLETIANSSKGYDESEIPESIRKKEKGLFEELSLIEKNWEKALSQGEQEVKKLSQKKEDVLRKLESHISLLRRDYPRYAALKYPRPLSPVELQLREKEVLVEFSIGDNTTTVFVVKSKGVQNVHKIKITKEELERRVKQFLEPFVSNRPLDFSSKSAKELYDLLLSDALKNIKDTERLIIVPDGILGLLPFEALLVKEGSNLKEHLYVSDKWTTTYSQSATALALTRMLKPSQANKIFFGIANPVYEKNDPRYVAYKQGKPQKSLLAQNLNQYAFRGITILPKTGSEGKWEEIMYPPLPETETEVKTIARLFNVQPIPPDVLLNISANETNLRKVALKDYRYLHFATHADLPGKVQGITEPFIILGQVENKDNDDGFLTLTEVLELGFDANMIVLSACSTGKGKIIEGEGVSNFARAFQHAGARSVIVSLWEVASKETVEYMESFYKHIKSGKSSTEALRLTRKEIKQKYPNPFYWAVFILHGE
ncbi:MAG: CHAT domain-containing protein [Nitrospiraceae bacterium]|nr:CHAT domain-containing protein [Nitrospiraceae bacterium]